MIPFQTWAEAVQVHLLSGETGNASYALVLHQVRIQQLSRIDCHGADAPSPNHQLRGQIPGPHGADCARGRAQKSKEQEPSRLLSDRSSRGLIMRLARLAARPPG